MKQYLLAVKEVFGIFFVAFLSVFLIHQFLAQPFLVQGASMEPNFKNGGYLLVDRISYRFKEPEKGDVIIFRYPQNRSLFYIKRIIGLPGEKIEIKGGDLFVNNNLLEEEYLKPGTETSFFSVDKFILGKDQYFVLGDNRPFSFDSRRWGPINEKDIIGVVRVRFWPRLSFFF